MSWSLASAPPPRGAPPATLESRVLFRVHSAALVEQAPPPRPDPNVVLITSADGAMVAFAPSKKLAILAEARARLRPQSAPQSAPQPAPQSAPVEPPSVA